MIKSASSLSLLTIIIACLFLTIGCNKTNLGNTFPNIVSKQDRIVKIKKSTVRIYVNGKPNGTGFIIDKNGLIATAFHVVGKAVPNSKNQGYITYASNIEVQFYDGDKLPAIPHITCIGQGLYESALKDYCILEVKTSRKLVPLCLGNFDDAYEGAHVYICGYSLIAEKPAVSFGLISTKWENITVSYNNSFFPGKRNNVEIARLDISMDRGNSGAPIVLLGNNPEDDRVIGIASFIATPLDQDLKKLVNAVKSYKKDSRSSSVCSIELFYLMKENLGSNSLFIKGCISIDSLRFRLQKITEVKP